MLFGKNIKMTDKHFIPVIVPNYDVEEALKIIKINVIKIPIKQKIKTQIIHYSE